LSRFVKTGLLSPFVPQRMRSFEAMGKKGDLVVLKEIIEAGEVTTVIDRTYPLREVPGPSAISKRDTLEEKSSSRCEARRMRRTP
jgi:hypothetical protein